MMVYFDTNVLIYAFSKNTDDERQKDISVKLVGDAIEDESLIVSELILCEFAFISHKLKENKDEIDDNLAFLSEYLKPTDITVHQRILEILKETSLYVSSFDVSSCPILYSFGVGDFSPEQGKAKTIDFNFLEINFG